MQTPLFLSALWVGLSIAAPVGPIGLLVIQRTLQHGRALGLATGFGAALADAVYGAVGAFGVNALIGTLQGLRQPLAVGGAVWLLWLAWRTWPRAAPGLAAAGNAAPAEARPALLAALAGSFVLTLANPATILSFIAIFGALLGQAGAAADTAAAPWTMVAGVLLGSALWWCVLAALVGALRARFDARARCWVGRLSALGLAGFALWLLLSGPA